MRTMGLLAGVAGLFAGLLAVPATGADDPPPITRKDIATSQNNLKQIGLAFHNYASVYNDRWATNIMDKDGKQLLSWRVAILPFIEQENLYKQFKLDEPWDSDTNKKLIEKMPKLYAPVRVKAKPGETFYQTFTGKGALFEPKAKYTIPQTPDGTSNTVLVCEAGEPVIWTKPQDLPFDASKPLPKLGGIFDGEANVLLCDGSVYRMKKNPDEKELKQLITPDDGMVTNFDKLKK